MKIPELDRTKERYWNQPSRNEIVIRKDQAYMTADTLKKLMYSESKPNGKTPGKMWKSEIGTKKGQKLNWYDEKLGVYSIPIFLIEDKEEFERFKREMMVSESVKKLEKKQKEKDNKTLLEALEIMKANPCMKYNKVKESAKGRCDHFAMKGEQIGKLVERKNQAYGSATVAVAEFLKIIYPDGIKSYQYEDLGLIVRVFDKLKRVANRNENNRDEFEESPWQDVAGYGIIGAVKDDKVF